MEKLEKCFIGFGVLAAAVLLLNLWWQVKSALLYYVGFRVLLCLLSDSNKTNGVLVLIIKSILRKPLKGLCALKDSGCITPPLHGQRAKQQFGFHSQ